MNTQTVSKPQATIKSEIHAIVDEIVRTYSPEKIVLFGSFAYGTPHPDSDVDLLIIKDTGLTPRKRRILVRQLADRRNRQIPFSPLVLTPQEYAERLAQKDPFYLEIDQKGRLLYVRK